MAERKASDLFETAYTAFMEGLGFGLVEQETTPLYFSRLYKNSEALYVWVYF